MPTNNALYIPEECANPMVVKASTYTQPKEHELVVKGGAVAMNPIDWMIQDMGSKLFPWIEYPFVGGSDIAGEVVEVGSAVTNFKAGDRVVAHAFGFSNRAPPQSAFQTYTVTLDHMTAKIPSNVSYEQASVIPLGLSTAACGLFQKDYLNLQHPDPSGKVKPNGQALLIWAGSSSVGSNAIQLASAAGYEVITTASPKNFDFCKKIGASQVFDYSSPTINQDLVQAFSGKNIAGAFAILPGSADACFEVVSKTSGSNFVAMALPVPENKPESIDAKFVFGGTLKDNEVGPMIWNQFLPNALANGSYIPAPEPQVVGTGLESIQGAFNTLKGGVSAKKVVVKL